VPDHPDHEQLAAFQAGDGDRRQRNDVEAHLEGCPSCAEVVASVELARRRLALLQEPELPTGLHDRLATAVGGQATGAIPALLGPKPWYRRPVAWGAAAALLLAALVAVPLLDQSGGDLNSTADAGGGGDAAQEAAQAPGVAGAAELPLLRVPGEVSAAAVRSRLAGDGQAKQALESAAAGAQSGAGAGGVGAAPRDSQTPAPSTLAPGPAEEDGYRSSDTRSPRANLANLSSCLPAATAAADPTTHPLVPAFFVEGTYQGRAATALVTTSSGQPGRVDLWVFPRGNCSTPPLATHRVR
jgi:hypothetical protein